MNQEVRAEWVQALRSGKYRQGEGALKEVEVEDGGEPKFCCLGVLCEIATKHGIAEIIHVNEYGNTYYGTSEHNQSSAFLPKPVQEWAAVDQSGHFDDDGPIQDEATGRVFVSLVDLNDSGWNFNAIADVIEKKF